MPRMRDDLDAVTGILLGVALGAWIWASIVFLVYVVFA